MLRAAAPLPQCKGEHCILRSLFIQLFFRPLNDHVAEVAQSIPDHAWVPLPVLQMGRTLWVLPPPRERVQEAQHEILAAFSGFLEQRLKIPAVTQRLRCQ